MIRRPDIAVAVCLLELVAEGKGRDHDKEEPDGPDGHQVRDLVVGRVFVGGNRCITCKDLPMFLKKADQPPLALALMVTEQV